MPGLRDPELKKEISKAFKLHGYQLRIEASRHLEELLAPVTLRSPWLEKILDLLAKKDLETNVVDKATIDKVIKVVCVFVSLWQFLKSKRFDPVFHLVLFYSILMNFFFVTC